ncbi:VOC family protein [Methylobacterium planeticum]|uniref:VOC family protein n=1 Tax=Methylobacterium planeticum TaxID=2615211 RepID=UPI001FEF4DB7|nr:VOC family protein [Methylobacterium planeticum]
MFGPTLAIAEPRPDHGAPRDALPLRSCSPAQPGCGRGRALLRRDLRRPGDRSRWIPGGEPRDDRPRRVAAVHRAGPEGIGPSPEPPHLGIEHIGLAVDDIEATLAELRSRNVPIVSGITDVRPGLRVIFIDGPDAVRIELLQRWPAS